MNIVQAPCPHCKNTLRIPVGWLDKPMRCKFCKNTFQARPKASETAAIPGKAPSPVEPQAPPPAPDDPYPPQSKNDPSTDRHVAPPAPAWAPAAIAAPVAAPVAPPYFP